ncbi:MAG: hemerythrin family protein [Proteobacteria bacterium]|nr:hemerythrin family protein [Pseudomonadota bacterium]MBU1612750.1 hemerythrin family protein [Pseudomonadota bacterium]
MALLEWSDALELGIPNIDEQHRRLLDTMNTLSSQIQHGKSGQGYAAAVQEMQDYTTFHFMEEETMMRISGFRHADSHASLHQKFIKETEEFAAIDVTNAPGKALELLLFIQEWLVDHILGVDLVFAQHYKESGGD